MTDMRMVNGYNDEDDFVAPPSENWPLPDAILAEGSRGKIVQKYR